MQMLAEKIELVLTRILESMDTEQWGADTRPSQADEWEEGKDLELDADTHSTLIEPCW